MARRAVRVTTPRTADPLSVAFRRNVLRIAGERGLNLHRLGVLVCPAQPSVVRNQLVGRTDCGVTLATLHRYAAGLGVDPCELIAMVDEQGASR